MGAQTVRVGLKDSNHIDETRQSDTNAPIVVHIAKLLDSMDKVPISAQEARNVFRIGRWKEDFMKNNQPDILPVTVLSHFPKPDIGKIKSELEIEISKLNRKIVVLDDVPTGIQTVHGVSVYTDWNADTVKTGFNEENSMFFILTKTDN